MHELPELGVGMIYFPALEPVLEAGKELIDVIEVEPQQYWVRGSGEDGSYCLDDRAFDRIRQQPQRKLVHGVGIPLAGSLGLDEAQIDPFKASIARLDPPWVSEHLAFLRAGKTQQAFNTGFLLPPLQSRETVNTAVRNLERLRAAVERPLAFENAANYLRHLPGEMADGEFLAAVAEQADCGLLLDLHNLWCNQLNGRQSVEEVLSMIPLERVWEIHLAGGDAYDGYWLDAHSGLVPEALMALCEDLFPCLPNLKSVVFEIMPDYLAAKSIGVDAMLGQLEAVRALWETRGSRLGATSTLRSPVALVNAHTELPSQSEWEQTLALVANRRHPAGALAATLADDPGVGVLQQLVASVRAGMLVDLLTLSYRLMVLHLGEPRVRSLMEIYWQRTLPEPFAGHEAPRFARFIRDQTLPVPHLDELLAYEVASMEAVGNGAETRVDFSCDPQILIAALRAGKLPDSLPTGHYKVTVEP